MKKKTLKMIILGLTITYIAIIIGVYFFQKYIIFQSDSLNKDYDFVFENPFEEFFLKTSDEVELNVLLFKTKLVRKGLVLYFHGNADNLQRWGKYHADFTSRGYDIIMMDFRGYGKSTGESDEALFYQDAKEIYDWAFDYPSNKLDKYKKEEVIIYGRSLGCAVASNLAIKVDAKKVILETPFNNLNNLFQMNARVIYLPFDLKYDFPNDKHLQKITKPVFIFTGTKDLVVPNASTEKLKTLLKPSDQYIEIEGAGHKNLNKFPKYHQELDLILK